ncbi:phosphodiester glycosidase family protein [Rubrivirga sp.]|uniref:phosphodiester glycosidase family protein n=1 Tax=Rubrivirga sp. TaxID=1885344 RepID=UPI003B527D54
MPRLLRPSLAACLALLPALAAAQALTLTPRPDAEEGLPPSVRVFDVTRASTPLFASLVRADLGADDWALEAVLSDEGSETVASFAADADVLVAVNGGYFGGTQSFSLVLDDGQTLVPTIAALTRSGTTFYPTRGAFGLSATGAPDVAWVYTLDGTTYAYPAPSPNAPGAPQPRPTAADPPGGAPWDVATAIGGGPVLVQDGQARLTWTEEVFFGGSGVDTTSARARTAVGYTATGELLIVAVAEANGLTLPALADLLVDLGAVEALNLDGGGSTALQAGGVGLVASSRPVVSALRIVRPPLPNETVFDNAGATYREVGDWADSANRPFVGGTPSRLSATGTGADRATFTFDGIDAGVYDVEAWWTAAPNRASDTPFTVYHGGEGRTIRVDQTTAAGNGRWNPLGRFDLGPGDSLAVTDDATGTTSPAYVVVDAVRLVQVGAAATDGGTSAGPTLRLGPNPTRGRMTVHLGVRTPGPVRIEVVDVLGRTVLLDTWSAAAGETTRSLDVGGLGAGRYLVRATTAGGTEVASVTAVR